VSLVTAALLVSESGGFGLVKILATPLLADESFELPTTFVALTVTKTLDPQARL